MSYKIYNCEIKLRNSDSKSNISLYSKEKYTEQDFQNIVIKSFLKHREEVIVYDIYNLFMSKIIKDSKKYEELEKSTASIKELGENSYPDSFKFINTKLLSKYIIEENKNLVKHLEFEKIPVNNIIVD